MMPPTNENLFEERAFLINDIADLTLEALQSAEPSIKEIFGESSANLIGYSVFHEEGEYVTMPIIYGFKNKIMEFYALNGGALFEVPFLNVGSGISISYKDGSVVYLTSNEEFDELPFQLYLNLGYISPDKHTSPNLILPRNKLANFFIQNLALGIDDLTPNTPSMLLECLKKGLIISSKVI